VIWKLTAAWALLVSSVALAAAQSRPQIPNSALPGRERQQLMDQFPQTPRNDPGLTLPDQTQLKKQRKRKPKKR
jgi:hypothetical protein